ncbi:MAG: thiamine ABC transporter substrate-binding protein [Roseiflexaceae bacterium]
MIRRFACLATLIALLAACAAQPSTAPISPPVATATLPPTAETVAPTVAPTTAPAPVADGSELRIMTHDSFSISQEVIAAFEQQHGAKVTILPSGDAGTALNKAILSKDAPIADLMFGVDNTFLSRALEADIFEPYASPALAGIADDLKIDSSNRLLPVDFGYVVINYDVNMLGTTDLIPYGDLRDLTKPEWKSKLVVQNPATSSPGLAFMLATIAKFGTEGEYTWLDYWRDLRANDVLVVEGWNDAYYTHFSGSSGQGPRPLVVSYATSPAAEVYFSEGKIQEPPTGNMNDGAFRQIEFVGILKGTQQRALAEQFVDFMLSKTFQEDIPLQMFVYPALSDAALPPVFETFATPPAQSLSVDPALIQQNRETWIKQWEEVVLR